MDRTRLTHREPRLSSGADRSGGGAEPQLGGAGWSLVAKHARLLRRLAGPAVAGDDRPPERWLWRLWTAALSGEIGLDTHVLAVLEETGPHLSRHLPSDALDEARPLLLSYWAGEPDEQLYRRSHALPMFLSLLASADPAHPGAAGIRTFLADLAGRPAVALTAASRAPAFAAAVHLRAGGADDGRRLRQALQTCPAFLPLLLDPGADGPAVAAVLWGATAPPESPPGWTPSAALFRPADPVLSDTADLLARWYANCPPGLPAEPGLRTPFGELARLPLAPGLRLLRIALDRLGPEPRWRGGFYDDTRPLVRAVRCAVPIGGGGPADRRAVLRDFLADHPGRDWARRAVLRAGLLNPLLAEPAEVVLDLPGLAELAAWTTLAGRSGESPEPEDALWEHLAARLRADAAGDADPAEPILLQRAFERIAPSAAATVVAEFAAVSPHRAAERVRRLAEEGLHRRG
jgi:hypothetical protein